MKQFRLWIALALFSQILGFASAATIILKMDELSPRPVHGVSLNGVSFDFRVGGSPSPAATFGGFGPGAGAVSVNDPSIEGPSAGILTLSFATPTPLFQFGVALNTLASLSPGIAVQLFDSGLQSLGIIPFNTSPLLTFTEAQFNYSGTPISRAVIDFEVNNASQASRFAIDNITFTDDGLAPAPGSTPTVPLLPSTTDSNGVFGFDLIVANPTRQVFIDPPVAVGYEYTLGNGMPNFASVEVPNALPGGDFQFTLEYLNQSVLLEAGVPFNFTSTVPAGVSSFRILDINPGENLNPANPTAFVTGLTFVSAGSGTVFQTPITVNIGNEVPEPSAFASVASAFACFVIWRRTRSSRSGGRTE